MEDLFRIVSDSLARHGIVSTLDHRRLRWSQWILLRSDSTAALLPSVPGLFALAEELQTVGGRRMLALFRISETDDIEATIDRLRCDETSEQKLAARRCFVRFAAIEDAAQRQSALAALQQWMNASASAASGIAIDFDLKPFACGGSQVAEPSREARATQAAPAPLPLGFQRTR
jgi:hypothetical protein